MLQFPNAKINLGLSILKKRNDGFHEIETCMYPIPWCDALEIIHSENFSFQSTGLPILGDLDNNLVVKAYDMLKDDFNLSPVTIHLHKMIPMGAGLGGGSSDAAFTIKILNELFDLKLTINEQVSYASKLGSDCTFFIYNSPSICTGRGEIISPCEITLSGLKIVLIKPDVFVSTVEAYSGVTPSIKENSLQNILQNNEIHPNQIINDFEESIFKKYPILNEIKQEFIRQGALYASMSGSGSVIYGLFQPDIEVKISMKHGVVKEFIL